MVLFIIKKSLTGDKLSIFKYLNQGDKILLIQDSVLLLNNESSRIVKRLNEKKVEVFALEDDVKIRGIRNNLNIKLVDYSGFVDLIENNVVFS